MATPTRTLDGLRLVTWSLLLYFVATLMALASSAALVAVASTGALGFQTVIVLGSAIGGPALILTLVLLILFLIGFFTLHPHRREFGPDHQKNMDRSLLLFIGLIAGYIAVFAIYFVLFFLAFISLISPFDPTMPPSQPTAEELQEALLPAMLAGGGLDIILALMVALLLYFMVLALISADHQFRLRIAMALFVIGSAASFVIFVTLYLTGNLLVPAFQENGNFLFPPISIQYQDVLGGLVKSSLQAAAAFLFWNVYRESYQSLQRGDVVVPPSGPQVP